MSAKDAEAKKDAALDLDALAEDDEFEEFEEDNWGKAAEGGDDEEERLWEDNWDDDEADDGFADQLRKELASSTAAMKE